MPPKLTLHIHRVSNVQLEKRFIHKPPKLYVEIEIKTSNSIHHPKTKGIRDFNAQWEEEFVLDGTKDNQIVRFYLKHAPTIGCDRIIGEAECIVLDLLPSSGTSPIQKDLKLYDIKGAGLIGTIVVSASYRGSQDEEQRSSEDGGEIPYEDTQESPDNAIQDVADDTADLPEGMQEPSIETQQLYKDAVQHLFAEANTVVTEQLGPDSLFGKVGQLRDRLSKLSGIVSTSNKLAQLHPWVDLAWQVCSSLYKVAEKQYIADKKIIDLVATMETTFGFIEDAEKIKEDAIPLRPIIEDLLTQVAECATFICTYLQPSFAKRAMKGLLTDPSTKIAEFTTQFIKIRESLMEKVQLHMGLVSSKVLGVVEELREFIIRTIAAQLSIADPVLQSQICAAINEDRSIVDSSLEKQFAHLLRRPLTTAAQSLLGPIVIVLDALDEYGDVNSRRSLLTLIANEFTQLPNNFRFLIMSRPELDIKNVYSNHLNIKSISLTDLKNAVPEIGLYLTSELSHIRQEKRVPGDWPKDHDIDKAA
ncbi:hypothetical protein QCA50_018908 [Cerrena zonata]|uniref:C2 domain-containing protein n=1 Tax=Cerrena zonata TaxID=2478898 RepID=A0AAW0FN74_9APHY